MSKRKAVLTEEQIEFRNKILKKKTYTKREKIVVQPKTTTRNEYMNNCMWWINEFEYGRGGKEDFIKSAICLRNYCNQIIEEDILVNN